MNESHGKTDAFLMGKGELTVTFITLLSAYLVFHTEYEQVVSPKFIGYSGCYPGREKNYLIFPTGFVI
jgi:hypothetical protein